LAQKRVKGRSVGTEDRHPVFGKLRDIALPEAASDQ